MRVVLDLAGWRKFVQIPEELRGIPTLEVSIESKVLSLLTPPSTNDNPPPKDLAYRVLTFRKVDEDYYEYTP